MKNLDKFIKINKEDYETLVQTGSVIVQGVTYNYSDDVIYLINNDTPHLYRHVTQYKIYQSSSGTSSYKILTLVHYNSDSIKYTSAQYSNVIDFINSKIAIDLSTYMTTIDPRTGNPTCKYLVTGPASATNGLKYFGSDGYVATYNLYNNPNDVISYDYIKQIT